MPEIQMQQINQVCKTYRMSFDELAIENSFIEDYIGFNPGEAPDPFPEIIAEIRREAGKILHPHGGFVLYDQVSIDRPGKRILVNDIEFQTEVIVTMHLQYSTSAAVFACTAGPEITALAADYNRKGKTIHAYIVDSIGSIVVEKAMDHVQEQLGILALENGMKMTNRYSPGYCNWDIREQASLFSLLPAEFCGINLSDSMLMKPIKSVSGIIGVGRNVSYDRYTCHYCKDASCIYRGKR
jgi:hypothetical protein